MSARMPLPTVLRPARRPLLALAAVSVLAVSAVAVGVPVSATANAVGQSPGQSTVGPVADFDGDGFGDLAVGVPGEGVAGVPTAGGVNVLYGSSSGIGSARNQFWSRTSAGVVGTAQSGSAFGDATAVGDFNQDGFSDLAIGAPYDEVGSLTDAGSVTILYGSASGLTASGNQLWSEASAGVSASADSQWFGYAMAAGDYNDDGFADLAIGVPSQTTSQGLNAGAVLVLYGSASGLTSVDDQFITGLHAGDSLGAALAAGNFDASAGTDLALGAPDETSGGKLAAGVVAWMSGTASGLSDFQQTLDTTTSTDGRCGFSLASYNRNNDPTGFADVAAGCPGARANGLAEAGGVDIHLGSAAGLGNGFHRTFSPTPQANAMFGVVVAAADLGKDQGGYGDDLVVGEPFRDIGTHPDAGQVVVYYQQSPHLVDYQVVRQGLNGTLGSPGTHDLFGWAVTTGDFDADGWADLAVGVPNENIGDATGAGGVNVLYGSTNGITSSGNQFWSQNSPGVIGVAEADDGFAIVNGRTD